MERLSRMKAWAHVAVLTCAALLAGCTGDAAGNAGVTTSAVGTPEPVATHVVVRGETLFEISRDTGVSIETLVELNEIPDANVIEVEQVLALEPPREPAASAVEPPSSEEPTDPVLAWFRVRWDQLPRPTVSDRAVSEGAIAALMVPAVVFALLLVWLLALGSRRVVLGAARGVGWLGASLPIPPPGGERRWRHRGGRGRLDPRLRAERADPARPLARSLQAALASRPSARAPLGGSVARERRRSGPRGPRARGGAGPRWPRECAGTACRARQHGGPSRARSRASRAKARARAPGPASGAA